ncbi:ABC transporter ATP-binding protein [Candidatus Ruminimicrobiellum ovillum]|uniref:ABC transporter ATP-binding protein n=1 Tax=Candidatus Ruminimicrobiellum ovillum TaxID=1947927 RepID=UPI003559DA8B
MKLETKNLTKNYIVPKSGEVNVLKGIDLLINSGEKVALTGPSGAGKSTLIHILGLMDKPTSGKVLIDDKDITSFTPTKLAKMRKENIGFVFQFHYLLADFTVMENILMPVWNERKTKKEYALNMLETMGLTDRANHMPNELSGGEQQRVALARALINNPKILFADEPTGNLDRKTGEKIETLMFEMCNKLKTTLLVVTHSRELANLADRQIKIIDGKIC